MTAFSSIIGHLTIVKGLLRIKALGKVSHAYLFTGPDGVGKRTVAMAFAQALLCRNTINGNPCALCRDCKQFENDNHPDFHYVVPQGLSIKIEQIRDIQRKMGYSPYQGMFQLCLFDYAECMTKEAANCFLKTLEEPSDSSVFILISSKPEALLPTVVSRCQQVRFNNLSLSDVEEGLKKLVGIDDEKAKLIALLSSGSIGKAVELAADKNIWLEREEAIKLVETLSFNSTLKALEMAEKISSDRLKAEQRLEVLLLWLRDILLFKITQDKNLISNCDIIAQVEQQGKLYSVSNLVKMVDEVDKAIRLLEKRSSIKLIMDVLFLQLSHLGGMRR